jgi:hypothetical protein
MIKVSIILSSKITFTHSILYLLSGRKASFPEKIVLVMPTPELSKILMNLPLENSWAHVQ